jgi:UDP-2-acetamido-3-amino-2,3-dideoxy-glucuronate N-acetyltransferase
MVDRLSELNPLVRQSRPVRIHLTADVSDTALLGAGTQVWHDAQIREFAILGKNCILGKGVYIDFGVSIGDNVKIQNRASIYHGTTLRDGVFVGPHVVFANDRIPRAITADGSLKTEADWEVGEILVERGASIGAASVILPGVTIGEFALVGAGSIVTKSVPPYTTVMGNPARIAGYICACGYQLKVEGNSASCHQCGKIYDAKMQPDRTVCITLARS